MSKTNIESGTTLSYESGDIANKGYRYEEAREFIEFCIDLDNQDDRLKHPSDNSLRPNVDPGLWNPEPIYDSRVSVAKDVVAFKKLDMHDQESSHWSKLYREIISKADSKYPDGWDEKKVSDDPDLNGFGPWQNAWLLYEGRGNYKGMFAIAIRGTVFSNVPSAIEDALFHPVVAKQFLSRFAQFADDDEASLHSGFTHATFTLLLDDKYGILRILHDKQVPAHSRLYIVGHSQGAAMATLTHAFFHYAMRHDDNSEPVFGLNGQDYKLKSYVFAQPKPGNYAFSADFASITQKCDNAIVINNDIDAVPQVPLTLQSAGDLSGDFPNSSILGKIIRAISGLDSLFRKLISAIAEPFVKNDARGYSYYYKYDSIGPIGDDKPASSWNFLPAGHVILVFGTSGDPNDPFLQHHATTYRILIREQLTD